MPHTYYVCLTIWTVFFLIGLCTVSRCPEFVARQEEHHHRAAEHREGHTLQTTDEEEDDDEPDVTISYALLSSRFWMMGLLLFNGVFFGVYVTSEFKEIDLDYLSDKTLTYAGSIGALANGASRIFWATLYDQYGFKRTYAVILAIQFTVSLVMYPLRASAYIYTLCVALTLLCEGGHFSLFPAAAANIFGLENGGQIFTLMFFAVPSSSMLGFGLVYFYQDVLGVQNIFLISSLLTAANMAILFFFDEQPMKVKAAKDDEKYTIQ